MAGEEVSVKAPGKVILIGGYSALEESNIAFVGAVDSYVTAKLSQNGSGTVELNAPQLSMSVKGRLDKEDGTIDAKPSPELLLFKSAAQVAIRYVSGIGIPVLGFSITTHTDDEFAYSLSSGKLAKSGLGSSAAVCVATVGSILKAFAVDFKDNDALHKLSQIAHYIATAKTGSGIDITASAYGSVICTRCPSTALRSLPQDYTNKQLVELVKSRWDQKIERFSLPKAFRLSYATFGEAMITTDAIRKVYEFRENDPHIYADLIKEINEENEKAVDALRRIKGGENGALVDFVSGFERGRHLTKKLGVLSGVGIEPDDCTQLIEESKKHGAIAAKLPGAGGKDAIAALSIDDASYNSLRDFWKHRSDIRILKLGMVENGAKVAPRPTESRRPHDTTPLPPSPGIQTP